MAHSISGQREGKLGQLSMASKEAKGKKISKKKTGRQEKLPAKHNRQESYSRVQHYITLPITIVSNSSVTNGVPSPPPPHSHHHSHHHHHHHHHHHQERWQCAQSTTAAHRQAPSPVTGDNCQLCVSANCLANKRQRQRKRKKKKESSSKLKRGRKRRKERTTHDYCCC